MTIPATLAEAETLYQQFYKEWEANLKEPGVKKPSKFGSFSSLLYTYAYANLGKSFAGKDAIKFATEMTGSSPSDPQELRHMSTQHGYNARGRGGIMPDGSKVPTGHYILIDMKTPAPGWRNNRSGRVKAGDWNTLLAEYSYECPQCGSRDGAPHNKNKNIFTKLEKGHMDPNKNLEPGNMIPQCGPCNRVYKNNAVFDKNGMVYALGNTVFLERSSPEVQQQCLDYLLKKLAKKS
jgi:hypothetical protein